jgi:hypothetical protein
MEVDEEKLESQLKAFLLQARNDSNYQIKNFETNNQNIRYTLTDNMGNPVMLGDKGVAALNKMIEILLDESSIRQKFSERTIKRILESNILTLIMSPSKGIDKLTKSIVSDMVTHLKDAQLSNREVIIPIANMDLKILNLQIGNVVFEYCKNDYFDHWKEHTRVVPPPNEDARKIVSEVPLTYENKLIARCVVLATNKEHALEKAYKEILIAINILRFYSIGIMKNNPRFYRMLIGQTGNVFSGKTYTFCSNVHPTDESKSEYNNEIQTTGYLYPFIITQEEVDLMNKLKLQEITQIVIKEESQKTELEKRVIKSINIFGNAMHELDHSIAFMEFIISLEVLLLNPRESKTILAERIALLLKDDSKERLRVSTLFQQLYDLRSNYVHAGDNGVLDYHISQVSYIGFFVLMEMLSLISRYTLFGDIIELFESNKYSGPKLNTIK